MRIEIGPVDADAARSWLGHVLPALRTVRAKQHLLPFRLPPEVANDIEKLLSRWLEEAEFADHTFCRVEDLDEDHVRALVRYWANLDSLTDDQLRTLGVDWSPPAARPFFVALTDAVASALAGGPHGHGDPFAALLVEHGATPVRSVYEPRPG